ncbi:hypothetical protein [Micromonospora pisi]|uniref:hypothetical protein n=1 Tax=Micromonospora pisi TaxID=589240 RepID=UPI0011C40FFC|nr:hypothetical protein [Micromonospora pisi]
MTAPSAAELALIIPWYASIAAACWLSSVEPALRTYLSMTASASLQPGRGSGCSDKGGMVSGVRGVVEIGAGVVVIGAEGVALASGADVGDAASVSVGPTVAVGAV